MDTYIEFLKVMVSRGDYGSERVKAVCVCVCTVKALCVSALLRQCVCALLRQCV